MSGAEALQAREDFDAIMLERHAHRQFSDRIWALKDSVTPYDGAYVALAERLGAPLITCDAKLSRAHGHTARIELLS